MADELGDSRPDVALLDSCGTIDSYRVLRVVVVDLLFETLPRFGLRVFCARVKHHINKTPSIIPFSERLHFHCYVHVQT